MKNFLAVFWLVLCLGVLSNAGQADPARNRVTVLLPDTGVYSYWVQSRAGTVMQTPVTVHGQKSVLLTHTVAAGDVLTVLDGHSGYLAVHPISFFAPSDPSEVTLGVTDFKPLALNQPLSPTSSPTVSPGPAPVSEPKPETPGAFSRLLGLVFGLIVGAGVIWLLWKLIQTRGEPLIALARKAGVDVPDPAEPDVIPLLNTGGSRAPQTRQVEKVPEEAGTAPMVRATVSSVRATPMTMREYPSLVGLQGAVSGTVYTLAERVTTIGRDDDNTIPLSVNTLSRRHARFERGPKNKITVCDEGSSNGIYVNGMRVQRAVLNDGDEVKMGDNYFRFQA